MYSLAYLCVDGVHSQCFPVCNHHSTECDVHIVLPSQSIRCNVEMQLPHAAAEKRRERDSIVETQVATTMPHWPQGVAVCVRVLRIELRDREVTTPENAFGE